MTYKFKAAARVPEGVTPGMVLAELDALQAVRPSGVGITDFAADQVITYPHKYPALRAFGPEDAEAAFRDAVRAGIAYAIRIVVEVTDDVANSAEIRARFLVQNADGDSVYEPIEVIVKEADYKKQLIAELKRDHGAFSRKQFNVLAEIERLIDAGS